MLLHAFFINAPRSARGERKNAVFFKIFIVKRFVCREALFRSNVVKDKIKMKEKVFQEFCLHYLVTVSSCFLHTHITGLGTLECMLIVLGPNPRVEFENISSKPAYFNSNFKV